MIDSAEGIKITSHRNLSLVYEYDSFPNQIRHLDDLVIIQDIHMLYIQMLLHRC